MPHAELHYSNDIALDAPALLQEIEDIILRHDAGAGETKGRAYPTDLHLHTHFKATIALLAKPHRTAPFLAALQADLQSAIKAHLPRPCWMSIDLTLSGPGYHTEFLE